MQVYTIIFQYRGNKTFTRETPYGIADALCKVLPGDIGDLRVYRGWRGVAPVGPGVKFESRFQRCEYLRSWVPEGQCIDGLWTFCHENGGGQDMSVDAADAVITGLGY